jgi:hypothetical protein
VLDAINLERMGRPTITIIQDRFETIAELFADAFGMPELSFLIEPSPDGGSILRDVGPLVAENLDAIVGALSAQSPSPEKGPR